LEKISSTDHVRCEGLQRVKEETNIVQTIKRRLTRLEGKTRKKT